MQGTASWGWRHTAGGAGGRYVAVRKEVLHWGDGVVHETLGRSSRSSTTRARQAPSGIALGAFTSSAHRGLHPQNSGPPWSFTRWQL